MRRWLTRIVMCLLLGVVTTVGVAWGSAVRFVGPSTWNEWTMVPMNVEHEGVGYAEHLAIFDLGAKLGIRVTQASEPSPFVQEQFADEYSRAGVPGWAVRSAIQEFQRSSPNGNAKVVYIEAMGWPRPTMWRGWRSAGPSATMNLYAGIPTKWTGPNRAFLTDRRIVLPIRFVWPAFIVEAIVLSTIWLGMLSGFGAARRGLRKKRGRCPMCAYDLRGGLPQAGRLCHRVQGCPECGWNRSDDQPPGEAGN